MKKQKEGEKCSELMTKNAKAMFASLATLSLEVRIQGGYVPNL